MTATTRWLVLDAMGVLYADGDDVATLLLPYLRELRSPRTEEEITRIYRDASLGVIGSREFWARCEVAADDADYTSRHVLAHGAREVLTTARERGWKTACMSNDVIEWAVLLRERFGLSSLIDAWCISGEVGARKPDPKIFTAFEELTGAAPGSCLFIDDREANVAASRGLGYQALRLGSAECPTLRNVTAWL